MVIQHNIAAMNANRNLAANNTALSKNLEKLSSGYRINRAGDDAAGLAISEKMRAQITGLDTAEDNANDGISLVQTAEGALTEVHSMLNRMVELADQSANGTYDDSTDRANLQKELDSLTSEVDRISKSTTFNGIQLLDGSLGKSTGEPATYVATGDSIGTNATITDVAGASLTNGQSVTVAAGSNATSVKVTIANTDGSATTTEIDLADATTYTNGTNKGKTLKEASSTALAAGDTATIDLSSVGLGKISVSASGAANLSDIATDLQSDISGAYTAPVGSTGSGLTLQIGDTADNFNKLTVSVGNMSSTSLGLGSVDISTQSGASSAIDSIKSAINSVSSTRGDLGAIQNRLEHTINNLSVTSENMTSAESRIRDVDMASEMMEYTKNNILTQASQSMLAQANQIPQGVLQLLQG